MKILQQIFFYHSFESKSLEIVLDGVYVLIIIA
jgi:hypothetical protein